MASKSFYVDINLNGNMIKNVKLEMLADSPDPETEARIYYNTVVHSIYFYNGTEWVDVGSADEAYIDIDRDITRDFDELVGFNLHDDIGGAQTIKISEFINNIFFPARKTTIALSMSGSSYEELGAPTDVFTKTFTAVVTLNDFDNDPDLIHDYTDMFIAGQSKTIPLNPIVTFTRVEDIDIASIYGSYSNGSQLKVTVNSVEHIITSNNTIFKVVLPYFKASNASNSLSGASFYNTFNNASNKVLGSSVPTSLTINYSFEDGDYLYFAIPVEWGKKVSSIIDNGGAGDDVISAFVTELDDGVVLADIVRAITRTGKWTEDYYVYVTKNALSEGEQSLQFNLTSV